MYFIEKNLLMLISQCMFSACAVAVSIESIKEIRAGKNTDVLRNKDISAHHLDDCAFSILYGDNFESLDLVASTTEESNIWVTGLNALIGANKCEKTSSY